MNASDRMKSLVVAGKTRQPLAIVYDGKPRVIEVHTVGLTRAGVPAVRVYQREGLDSSHGWKLLHVGKIEQLRAAGGPPVETRPDHQPNDAQMDRVLWAMPREKVDA